MTQIELKLTQLHQAALALLEGLSVLFVYAFLHLGGFPLYCELRSRFLWATFTQVAC